MFNVLYTDDCLIFASITVLGSV